MQKGVAVEGNARARLGRQTCERAQRCGARAGFDCLRSDLVGCGGVVQRYLGNSAVGEDSGCISVPAASLILSTLRANRLKCECGETHSSNTRATK